MLTTRYLPQQYQTIAVQMFSLSWHWGISLGACAWLLEIQHGPYWVPSLPLPWLLADVSAVMCLWTLCDDRVGGIQVSILLGDMLFIVAHQYASTVKYIWRKYFQKLRQYHIYRLVITRAFNKTNFKRLLLLLC